MQVNTKKFVRRTLMVAIMYKGTKDASKLCLLQEKQKGLDELDGRVCAEMSQNFGDVDVPKGRT
jgi:hypothetical protein